jgi:signal transduction histidine kinase
MDNMEDVQYYKEQLKRQEKLASLGLLSAGIAHEVQNPLNFVINFSKTSQKIISEINEIIEENCDKIPDEDREDIVASSEDLRSNLEKILSHAERAVNIVRDILQMSRGKENEMLPTDICRIVKEYVWLSYHAMRANLKNFNISIKEQYAEGAPIVKVIPQDLSRAVLNLMNNACYAVWSRQQTAPSDYQPEISVNVTFSDTHFTIIIADNGTGMSDEVKQKLYDNFFTTKPAGQGTGLGMSITREIVETKHKGRLSFDSTEGKGTCFTIEIPITK